MDLLDGYQAIAQEEIDALRRRVMIEMEETERWHGRFRAALQLAKECLDQSEKKPTDLTRRFEMLKVLKDNDS